MISDKMKTETGKRGEKMATIRCKSCGRVYQYEKNGTCPKCGAYNRPPRKEIVEADGSIRYVTTENKVCYEEEECYEDAVKQHTGTYTYTPTRDKKKVGGRSDWNNAANKLRQKRNQLTKTGQKKSVAVIAIVTALISAVTTLIGNISERREPTPEPSWEDVAIVTGTWDLIAKTGDEIPTENGFVSVSSYYQNAIGNLIIELDSDDPQGWSSFCSYESLVSSGEIECYCDQTNGDHYNMICILPPGIGISDCAVVLDVPFKDGVNRYWVWLERSTYEPGEAFAYCNQRVCVDSWSQEGTAINVHLIAENEEPVYAEAYLTVLNAAEQPYDVYWHGIQSKDALFADDYKLRFDFTLRNENDIPQSITFVATAGNQRQITVNLQ